MNKKIYHRIDYLGITNENSLKFKGIEQNIYFESIDDQLNAYNKLKFK